ncbi:unnamed protein product, partial [Vitis vinifera]|uniref:Uncharacterized protein n=1 Tax=Vitis vinifera TaxID=29760 RepID=D7TTY2_VITVI
MQNFGLDHRTHPFLFRMNSFSPVNRNTVLYKRHLIRNFNHIKPIFLILSHFCFNNFLGNQTKLIKSRSKIGICRVSWTNRYISAKCSTVQRREADDCVVPCVQKSQQDQFHIGIECIRVTHAHVWSANLEHLSFNDISFQLGHCTNIPNLYFICPLVNYPYSIHFSYSPITTHVYMVYMINLQNHQHRLRKTLLQ